MKFDKVGNGEFAYYQANPKERARPIWIMAGIAVFFGLANMGYSVYRHDGASLAGLIRIGVVVVNIIAMVTYLSWRRVRARWQLWTQRFRYRVALDHMGMHTAIVFDAPWCHYIILDPMKSWMRDNLSGRYGILSEPDHSSKDILATPPTEYTKRLQRRTFWFSNPNDAFAFKMRWYKSPR